MDGRHRFALMLAYLLFPIYSIATIDPFRELLARSRPDRPGYDCRDWANGEIAIAFLYAARVVSARLIHFAMSAERAPIAKRDLMRRSRETEGAPASILATRD